MIKSFACRGATDGSVAFPRITATKGVAQKAERIVQEPTASGPFPPEAVPVLRLCLSLNGRGNWFYDEVNLAEEQRRATRTGDPMPLRLIGDDGGRWGAS